MHFTTPAFVHHFLQVLRILLIPLLFLKLIISKFLPWEHSWWGSLFIFLEKKKTHLWKIVLLEDNFRLIFFPGTWMVLSYHFLASGCWEANSQRDCQFFVCTFFFSSLLWDPLSVFAVLQCQSALSRCRFSFFFFFQFCLGFIVLLNQRIQAFYKWKILNSYLWKVQENNN